MKKLLLLLSMLMFNIQQASAMNIDKIMDEKIAPISDKIAGLIFYPIHICGSQVPLIIFWILIAGIFFTIYYKGISIWGFKHAIDVVAKPPEDSHSKFGEVSSFQALQQHFQEQ